MGRVKKVLYKKMAEPVYQLVSKAIPSGKTMPYTVGHFKTYKLATEVQATREDGDGLCIIEVFLPHVYGSMTEWKESPEIERYRHLRARMTREEAELFAKFFLNAA